MTNNPNGFQREIKIKGQRPEEVENFKYLGPIISNEESNPDIVFRIAQTTAALSRLKLIWRDRNISLASKVKLMRTIILSTFLYVCESWTLTAQIERRIQALEMKCYRRLLNISYKDHVTNEEVHNRSQNAIGVHDDLLTMVKKRKLRWYGYISRSSGMAKIILQGTVKGGRRRGRQKKKWEDNIKEWTGMGFEDSLRAAKDREGWKGIVATSSLMPRRPPRLRDWDEMRWHQAWRIKQVLKNNNSNNKKQNKTKTKQTNKQKTTTKKQKQQQQQQQQQKNKTKQKKKKKKKKKNNKRQQQQQQKKNKKKKKTL